MHTLHEFFLRTEGIIYLLLAAVVLGFTWFFHALTRGEDEGRDL
ncbi:sulfate respiration complex protein HmcD [Elusimicrobiota bacterium]